MIVSCAGMYRSGSTWQYQVACELVRCAGRTHQKLGFLQGEPLVEFFGGPRDPQVCYLYKTHSPDPAHLTLSPDEVRTLYSYRDLRDVAWSMAYKIRESFDEAIRRTNFLGECIASDAFWRSMPNVYVQRYETWLGDNLSAVRGIAAHLGVGLPEAILSAIADEFDLDRNRSRTDGFSRRMTAEGVNLYERDNRLLCDPESLLHWNHLRSGAVGQWRTLSTVEDRAFLASACGDWLAANGYEPDAG